MEAASTKLHPWRRWFIRLAGIGFLLWAVVLFFLSSRTMPQLPDMRFPQADKVLHFGYFGVGGALLALALGAARPAWPVTWRVALVVALILSVGIVDEWHQTFTPGRSGGDPFDVTADLLGGLFGSVLASWLYDRFLKRVLERADHPTPAGDRTS